MEAGSEQASKILSGSLKDILMNESDPTLSFRVATEEDATSLIPLVNKAYEYENIGDNSFKLPDEPRLNEDRFKQAMDEGVIIVATNPQSEREIVGCVQYKDVPSLEEQGELDGYFGLLAVKPSAPSWAGKKLIDKAEAIAKSRGRKKMQIQVVDHSTRLQKVYGRYGYQEFDRVNWEGPFLTKPTQFVRMSKPLLPGNTQ